MQRRGVSRGPAGVGGAASTGPGAIPAGGEDKWHAVFAVFGTTGNVYECHVCANPSCTCPDFTGDLRTNVLCNTVSHKANAYKSDRLCCVIHNLSLLRCCRDSPSVLKLWVVFGEFGVKIGALVKSQPCGAGGLPAVVIASYTAALRSNLFRR